MESVQTYIKAGQSSAKAWKAAIDERVAAIAALRIPCWRPAPTIYAMWGGVLLSLMFGQKAVSMPSTPVIVLRVNYLHRKLLI